MTRVSSYQMYQCPSCKQIHISPIYSSVSVYVPKDLILSQSDLKSCSSCRNRLPLKSFLDLGIISRPSKDISWLIKKSPSEGLWKKISKVFNQKSKAKNQPEPSDIYPYLQD